MTLPPVYSAVINIPGYSPQADELATFETAREAWAYLAGERERDEDAAEYSEPDVREFEYSDEWDAMRLLGLLDENIDAETRDAYLAEYALNSDGTGTVYADTPGYTGDHDQGLAYSVTAIPHADYPHEPGRLHDCRACEAQCHCTEGSAQCVYSAGYHNGLAVPS